jgi:hypothetical protein
MKKSILIFSAFLCLLLNSCSNDDGFYRLVEPVALNQFCYGPNIGDDFNVAKAFNSAPQMLSTDVYTTTVIITDSNFSLNTGVIVGMGSLVTLTFTGNQNFAIQSGLYSIGDDTATVGNVSVSYSLDFDTAQQLNESIVIQNGYLRVRPYNDGFAIEIDGRNEDDVRFHGNFLGNLILLN